MADRARAVQVTDGRGLWASLQARAADLGLAALGVAPAERMDDVREVLEDRRSRGLDGGMQFTYRNPERSTNPQRILRGARSVVVGALAYGDPHELVSSPGRAVGQSDRAAAGRPRGQVALYARRDYYAMLRSALGAIAHRLEEEGWRARVVADDNALVDRAAAHKAGLGWFGKNCNMLLPDLGSMFVLGSVVTDAALPTGETVADGCGTCKRCHSACPTGAFVAPGVLDASRCLAWLLQKPGDFPVEFRAALGDRLYGCDDCQTACPVNKRAARATPRVSVGDDHSGTSSRSGRALLKEPEDGSGGGDLDQVDILELLAASDTQLLERFGRWYIPKRDARVLRRNALVVLGNTADGRDPEVQATLEHYLGSGDPLLASHAAWAAERLGRQDLVSAG